MWSQTTSMGMNETACGTRAKDRTTVGPGGMALSTTFDTLAPKAPPCRVVSAGAFFGVSIATVEKRDAPRLSPFSPAIQVEVIPGKEPDNTGGQLPLHP